MYLHIYTEFMYYGVIICLKFEVQLLLMINYICDGQSNTCCCDILTPEL